MNSLFTRSMLRHLVRPCCSCALLGSAIASAQTLQVTPLATNYSAKSSTISYDVNLAYPGTPGAIGLRVLTPSDWTYKLTTGTNPPNCLDAVGAKQDDLRMEFVAQKCHVLKIEMVWTRISCSRAFLFSKVRRDIGRVGVRLWVFRIQVTPTCRANHESGVLRILATVATE